MVKRKTFALIGCLAIYMWASGIAFSVGVAFAQDRVSPLQTPTRPIDADVAIALYDRGMVLLGQSDFGNAKTMFRESLERSPTGARSADALGMLRRCNKELGLAEDDGRPLVTDLGGPVDPYDQREPTNTDVPIDPYQEPLPSTGDTAVPKPSEGQEPPIFNPSVAPATTSVALWEHELGWYGLLGHGGVLGASGLLAMTRLVGVESADDSFGALSGLFAIAGLGGGGYLTYRLAEIYKPSAAQSAAIATVGFWAMYNGGHLGNLLSGEETDLVDVYAGLTIGGALGTGLGLWYAYRHRPDVKTTALVNSFSLYGTSAALMIGLALAPPKADAYSLNAVVGSALGIASALYLQTDLSIEPERLLAIDMGAGIGALAPWLVLYPLLYDTNSDGDEQAAGFFSAVGIGGGAYLAWYLTRDDLGSSQSAGVAGPRRGPPALVQRNSLGTWSLSVPVVRPMDLPVLAPSSGLVGTDILGGRF